MTASAPAHSPSFNDLIVASDIVDTIRNDERLIDHELGSEDRQKALKARLKDMYKAQGMEVSDAVIDEAVRRRDAERFVFKPMATGFGRFLWTSYVRRNKYALRLSVVAGIAVLGVIGFRAAEYQFVEKPRIEAARQKVEAERLLALQKAEAARQLELRKAEEARQLELQLTEVLPNTLKAGVEEALASANRLHDEVAKSEIAALQTTVGGAIRARNVEVATLGIMKLHELGQQLKATETRRELMASAKQIVDVETPKIAGLKVEANAREALYLKLNGVGTTAESADRTAFQAAIRSYNTTLTYVQSTYDIRIVERRGVQSGFWRYDVEKGKQKKFYYLAVEAVDRTGRVQAIDVKNVEDGLTSNVQTWGIRVPQQTYDAVGADKQADGIIDNAKVGVKPAGSIDVRWDIPTINDQRVTSW